MKKPITKLITGMVVLGIAGAIYSFTSSGGDNPEAKRYEVIRMKDGQLTQYDTVVAVSSGYTPQDYLNDLGFGNDEHISIINMLEFDPQHVQGESGGEHEIIVQVDESGNHSSEAGEHEIIIEKRVVKTGDGDAEDIDIEIDIEGITESINIDSIIAVHMSGEGDSGQVFMHKIMIIEDEGDSMVWHGMNTDGATFHHESGDEGHHLEIAVWGDGEDFTLVIVTNPNDPNLKMASTDQLGDGVSMKLYPNPASETSLLQFSFKDKAQTEVTISDMKGNIVAKIALGDFSGEFNHEIQVSRWPAGVYFVQVDHGDQKIIEKLIVE